MTVLKLILVGVVIAILIGVPVFGAFGSAYLLRDKDRARGGRRTPGS